MGLHLDSAQQGDVKLAQTTLETVRVQPPRGRPRARPKHLVADKGCDSRSSRHYLRSRGIAHTIPPIRRRASVTSVGYSPSQSPVIGSQVLGAGP